MTTERLIVRVDDSEIGDLNKTLNATERQLREVNNAAKKTDEELDKAAGASMDLGAAAGAMGAAVGIAAAAMAVAANAVALYTEKTAEQDTAMNTFLNTLDKFNLNLGESIVESEGVSRALAIFDAALNNSEGAVDGVSGAISTLVDGGLFVLEAAIQTGIATFGLYKLAVVAAEGAMDTIFTNIAMGTDTVRAMTSSVISLGLALGTGLISMVQMAVTKLGEFATAMAPFAARIGLDLSGVTAVIGGVNEGLDQQLQMLRDLETANQAAGNDARADRLEREAQLIQRRNERDQESLDIMNETGESMMGVAGAFNATGESIERTRRSTEGAAGATEELTEAQATAGAGMFSLGLQLATNLALQIATNDATQTAAAMALQEAKANQELNEQLMQQKITREEVLALQRQMLDAEAALSAQLETAAENMNPVRDQMMGALQDGASKLAEIGVTSLATAVTSGKNVGKEFRKMMGEMLMAQGKASVLQGALMLIPFGPQFNPVAGPAYIGQGAAMMGLGMAFGATASGGGGGGAAAPTVAAPSAGSMQQTYVTNNFQGMFNDPRESARIIGDATEQAALRGTN
jgi:hypothetical protein